MLVDGQICPGVNGQLLHGTVGQGDVLYVPGGWIVAERVAANLDFAGFRVGVVFKDNSHIDSVIGVREHLMECKAPSDTFTKLCAALRPAVAAAAAV